MANLFNSIRVNKPKRNHFNLSHNVLLTGKAGNLIPIMCQEVLPSDSFKISPSILCRFAPMVAPQMTGVDIKTYFFFVPDRLIWDKSKEFFTGGVDGTEAPLMPVVRYEYTAQDVIDDSLESVFGNGSLYDYLGFPTQLNKNGGVIEFPLAPFKAYALIWNEYFRDQNLSEELEILKDVSGTIDIKTASEEVLHAISGLLRLRPKAWKKDYFTSALPFPQRGEDVELPLQGDAPIKLNDDSPWPFYGVTTHGDAISLGRRGDTNQGSYSVNIDGQNNVDGRGKLVSNGNPATLYNYVDTVEGIKVGRIITGFDQSDMERVGMHADLSQVSSATINELRRAIKAQEFLEVRARGGSRYIEQIFSFYGVKSSDARLQRPEYLGGANSPVVVSDVLQTSQTTDSSALGTPGGNALGIQKARGFKRYFEEHGWIIGLVCVMPKAMYFQGMPRKYLRRTCLDYYWPQFQHLGEQGIKKAELFWDYSKEVPSLEDNSDLFGYTPRYAEYRYIPDTIHGDFRGNLMFWHMARNLPSSVALNEEFVTNVENSFDRVFAVTDSDVDKIWMNVHISVHAKRPMSKYGTPMM